MKKILIIEDDYFVAEVYGSMLTAVGYKVAIARDGESGLRQVFDFEPDLVQVDLMMPKMGGVEIIKRIRAHPGLSSLPVLVLSSCCDADLVQQARDAGASDVISKRQYSPALVTERVEALLAASAAPVVTSVAPAHDPTPSAPVPGVPFPPGSVPGTTESEIRHAFIGHWPQTRDELRNRLHALIKIGRDADPSNDLQELQLIVHHVAGAAGIAGLSQIAHLAGALEILLQELHDQPKKVTASTLNTLARAVDGLGHLFQAALGSPRDDGDHSALILAVDDEPIALQTLVTALGRASLKAVSLDDPELALRVLALNRFDLVFLDVEMPGMDGFELCKRLRALPTNPRTPVVHVTSLSGFKDRVRATLSGSTDLIAKPFPLIEVAVKALTYLANGKPDTIIPAPAPTAAG